MEMGWSLVIGQMIKSKKPLIGHNCMYDWMYIYNQHIQRLPDTYAEFITHWNELFPHTYDNKVLCRNSKLFQKTTLGVLFDEVTTKPLYTKNLSFKYDTANGFGKYENTEILSHYHEAAYDAQMTGVVFAHVCKLKEVKGKDGVPEPENANLPCDFNHSYVSQWKNCMMLDHMGSDRLYHLDMKAHQAYLKTARDEFPDVVHLQF